MVEMVTPEGRARYREMAEKLQALKDRAAAEAEVIALARQLSGEVDYPMSGNVALDGDAWRTLTQLCIAAKNLRFA